MTPILSIISKQSLIISNVFLSLLFMIYHFYENRAIDLWGDAQTYIMIAKDMSHIYDTGIREPLWIWFIKIFSIIDVSEIYRCSTMLIQIICIIALYKLLKNISNNKFLIFISLSIFSLNPYLTFLGIQAMRDSGILFLIILLTYSILNIKSGEIFSKSKFIKYCLVVCLLALIKIQYLFASYLISLYLLIFLRCINYKQFILLILLPLIFCLPHFYNNFVIFGDPFYSLNIHLKWMRNFEINFLINGDSSDMYGGPPINSFEYIFLNRDIFDVIYELISGFIHLLIFKPYQVFIIPINQLLYGNLINININFAIYSIIFLIPVAIGLFKTLYDKKLFLITSMPFLLMNFSVILAEYLDPRIYNYIYIFLSFWFLIGLNKIRFTLSKFFSKFRVNIV